MIKRTIQQSARKIHHSFLNLCVWLKMGLLLLTPKAFAELPQPVNPNGEDPNGDYVQFMQGWTGLAISYIALAISGAGFLWVGWILLSKFNEARSSNDPDWGSVGLTAVIAGVLLVIVTYFLRQAITIIPTT